MTCCGATFVANLRYAASELGKHGIRLLIEPINRFDIPGFYLNTRRAGASIIDEVGPTTCSCSTTSTTRSAWRAS